jgi:hypothetical protein
MALSLFSRVADLGTFEPARHVLSQLMSTKGPFGSLESIEEHELGEFLERLAIIAPDDTIKHLTNLIMVETIDELRQKTKSRRDIVWALEKLAWHSRSFEQAADCLSRLAIAEIETYGNNATGIWKSLFGAILPATAASPNQRINYLKERATSDDCQIRLLTVEACDRALERLESVHVSAERQEGVLVEPRGSVISHQEASEYYGAILDILSMLCIDKDDQISDAASRILINSIHTFGDNPLTVDRLIEVLTGLRGEALVKLRLEIEHLRTLYKDRKEEPLLKTLDRLEGKLPQLDDLEQLHLLLQLQPWDLEESGTEDLVKELLHKAKRSGRLDAITQWLEIEEIPSAWHLGSAFAKIFGKDEQVMLRLSSVTGKNISALSGYLRWIASSEDENIFDILLDQELGESLPPKSKLFLTVRGPATAKAIFRAKRLIVEMPIVDGAYGSFAWQEHFNDKDLEHILKSWLKRIDSQISYNAAIDWVHFAFHKRSIPQKISKDVLQLLIIRRQFSEIINKQYDWSQLANRIVKRFPIDISNLILNLINEHKLILVDTKGEAEVLVEATKICPDSIWSNVTNRIESGEWRVSLSLRGWFADYVPLGIIETWIGLSKEHAKIAASISSAGQEDPSSLMRFLLENFGGLREVRSSLVAEFLSGSWVGGESDHISQQIDRLEQWSHKEKGNTNVKKWSLSLAESLKQDREKALEREAEEEW